MKIAFVDYVFERHLPIGTSGLSEVVWNLASPLAASGNEIHVAGPYLADAVPSPAVRVHRFALPPIGYRNIIGHILIIRRALAALRPYAPFDVIHAPDYLSTALACSAFPTTPVVLTEPGNIYERIANGNPYDYVTTQVFKWAAQVSARRCARIIATSDEMAYWWQHSGASAGQIAQIPLGVNLDGFRPISTSRAQLGWSKLQKHVLFVARLSPETGAAALLRALPAVLQVFPLTVVHMVGSGPEAAELRKLAVQLDVMHAVVWHGWVLLSELAQYYSAADVMVFPGSSGGTPRVMLQAMACGVPFVGSAIGGIVDHIDPNSSGWLAQPGDSATLAAHITAILRNPVAAGQRAEQARTYVHTLAWPSIAQRVYQEVYRPYQSQTRPSVPVVADSSVAVPRR